VVGLVRRHGDRRGADEEVEVSTPAAPTAAGRRARFGLLTLVMVLAATASAVIAVIIGERTSIRFDATDTGEHHLSPKTTQLLANLAHDYEVVLAVNRAEVDPRALQRVRDVADLIGRSSPRITVTNIDTASASGLDQFDALLTRLGERDRTEIQKQVDAVNAAIAGLDEGAAYFADPLPAALRQLGAAAATAPEQGAKVHEVLETQASIVTAEAKIFSEQIQLARATLQKPTGGAANVPATDQAAAALASSLRQLAGDLGKLELQYVSPVAGAESMPQEARAPARPLAAELLRRRDRAALLADSMARLKPLDLQRIARALESTSAVLVVGPAGVGLNAIDPTALFPGAEQIDLGAGVQADLRRKAEDLFATSVGMLEDPLKPVVMLVHGQPQRVLENAGFFGAVAQRLSLQGLDMVEWPVVLEPQPPSLASVDPAGTRPVVFIVLATDPSKTMTTDPNFAGPTRASTLGQALDALVERGEPIMLCLQPSTLPSYGQPDPMTASLRLFGLQADTARPIIFETTGAGARQVGTDHVVRADQSDHPIWRAVQGLPAIFPWPIAIRPADPPAGARVTRDTLYSVAGKDSWAEAQWLGFWQVPPEQRPSVIDPPTPNSTHDDSRGPWPIAVAATRWAADLTAPERLVVVGSNTWFFNGLITRQSQVYGRLAPLYPGNAELFEAAIAWLAGKDGLIAQTTTARAIPLIRPLTEGQLSLWRWSVVGGIPLLVLLAGLAWRILRG
jgi:hypothetical protein